MNTAVINVKVNPTLKAEVQALAKDLGLSLSSLINAYLKHLVRTKTVIFSTSEEPNDYLLQILKKSKNDIRAGRVVSFKNANEALSYLDKLIVNDKKSNKG